MHITSGKVHVLGKLSDPNPEFYVLADPETATSADFRIL